MRALMCPPTFFDVLEKDKYGNMHMDPENKPDTRLAMEQWEKLVARHEKWGISPVFIDPVQGLPDMSFTANCGFVFEKDGEPAVILSNFRPERRRGEKEHYRAFFRDVLKYRIFELPDGIFFEGAGDAIPFGNIILMGYGFRTSLEAAPLVSEITGKAVLPLALTKQPFGRKTLYHLDTTMIVCNRDDRLIVAYPNAFDRASLHNLSEGVKKQVGHLFAASYKNAVNIALNSVVIPKSVMNEIARAQLDDSMRGVVTTADTANDALLHDIRECEYEPDVTPLSEFIKSGGGACCLTLLLPN